MRIDNTGKDKKKDKKKSKRQSSILEAEIFAIMQKGLKTAIDAALDEIFKDWK